MKRVGGEPFPCGGEIPAAVEAAWGFQNSPYCPGGSLGNVSLSKSSPLRTADLTSLPQRVAQIAVAQVNVSDTPASTNFSLDCDPYTTMVGAPASTAGCGVDPTFGVVDSNEVWCADFAKWVWASAGLTAGLGTLDAGANSFYTWGRQEGSALIPDGNNPAPGDAVVFYPNGDLNSSGLVYADHVAIVAGVNADGTVNLVNGDFLGPTNISVQLYDDVSIGPWSSSLWNSNEQWVYVSPGGGGTSSSGVPSAQPAAVVNSPSLMNVFYNSSTGSINDDRWTPTTNWVHQTLPGGGAIGGPAAVVNSSSLMNVFYTDSGGRINDDYWTPTTNWVHQTLPGGGAIGDPAAVVNSSSLMNVFYTDSGGRINDDYWTPTTNWVHQTLPGGGALGHLSAVVNSPGWINVFYTATSGRVYADYWTPATGWLNQPLPGGGATGAPSAIVNSSTWMNVFYNTNSNGLVADYWTPLTGWAYQPLPGVGGSGTPAAVVNSPTWMNVWYLDPDGQIDADYWTSATGWVSVLLPSAGATGTPTALVNSPRWMNVFYVAGSQLEADYWTPTTGWLDQALPV